MPKPTKRLLIDAGNSRIKLLYAVGRQLQIAGFHSITVENLGSHIPAMASADEILLATVSADDWIAQLQALGLPSQIPIHGMFSPAQHPLLRNAYPQHKKLGVDRWLAMLGARISTDEALCVVDLGTATTLDAVDKTGQHLGGWIIPGLDTSRNALYSAGHLLQNAQQGNTPQFANNTADAIAAGTCYAQAGAIERFLDEVQQQGLQTPRLFLTGGWAQEVLRLLSYEAIVDPFIVFRGMLAQHLY